MTKEGSGGPSLCFCRYVHVCVSVTDGNLFDGSLSSETLTKFLIHEQCCGAV